MPTKFIFLIVISLATSIVFSRAIKYFCARKFFSAIIYGIIVVHFSVSFIFGVLGSKSNDYQTYAYLFVVNAVLALFSTPIVYQITKLRLVLNPIKGALLCTVTLIAFSWVLVFGAGNGHGAFALPLPASVFVFLGFYHGLLGRQEAYIFASALSQLVLSYTIFWSSVQHHRIKFERSITSTKL